MKATKSITLYGVVLLGLYFSQKNFLAAQSWPADTIQISINSGNPQFPFPQFYEYEGGKTLALYNPPGVVHAEMEKSTRDAYRIMMNRAIYSGEQLGTVKYIKFNDPSVPQGYGTFVSEGDGYALLAAAYMADKKTFDGLWCWVHDNRLSRVKRFYNCTDLRPGYRHGKYTAGWDNTAATAVGSTSNDAAADGDFDIGLALLVAWKQWGDNMGQNDACGNPISYKQSAIDFIKGMVDTTFYNCNNGAPNPYTDPSGCNGYYTGNIGFDGYIKSGNTWGEMTNWASGGLVWNSNTWYLRLSGMPVTSKYVDYMAPAYFRAFADFLTAQNPVAYDWHINQYKRAEASSDWVMGKLYDAGGLPYAGTFSIAGTNVSFGGFAAGEDFRLGWRTILNYVWHGNPTETWNPTTHQRAAGGNTWERDMAIRNSDFLKKPYNGGTPVCAKLGFDPIDIKFEGSANLVNYYNTTGTAMTNYYLNWVPGVGAISAVGAGDLKALGELYRQCEIEWDAVNPTPTNEAERYLQSTPKYFHGWFRLLGMLTATGNMHTPADIVAGANMKVYKAVSKTFGFPGDTLKYTISYRNYGSVNATGVKIEDVLPAELNFVSASNGGTFSGGKVTWNIGTVPGFTTAGGVAPTVGEVTVICRIKSTATTGRFCNTATISCTNGTGWTSNEYANRITATLEQNCVDIINRALIIDKTADRNKVNPGDTVLYTVRFENSSTAGWLNGGRPGVTVTHAYGTSGPKTFNPYFRIFNGAVEPYIDYGNYRVSYYLNENSISGLFPADPNGWKLSVNILEGGDPTKVKFDFQKIPFGSDAYGAWDQRLIIRFAPALATTAQHLYNYFGVTGRVHRGVYEPLRTQLKLETATSLDILPVMSDGWSFPSAAESYMNVGSNDKETFAPITPDWTEFLTYPAGRTVDRIHIDECRTKPNFSRILVEEFDGYAWRRVFGNGPMPGRETYDVYVRDTIPADFDWIGFTDQEALGVNATYNATTRVVEWYINTLLVGSVGDLAYNVKAKGACPMSDKLVTNYAWIWASTESKVKDSVNVTISCSVIPPPPPPVTTMKKFADKTVYAAGETITYTIGYKQTHGTIADPSLNNSTDWKVQAGLMPSFSAGVMDIRNPFDANARMATYDYSHGTNGIMTGRVSNQNYQALTIFARYQDGTGYPAGTNGVYVELMAKSASQIQVKVFNGTTQVGGTYDGPFSGATGTDPFLYNFKLEFIGNVLKIWAGATTGPALTTITGVTVQAGYAGVLNGPVQSRVNYAENKILDWVTNLDSAFDVVLTDKKPSQVSNPVTISSPGTYNTTTEVVTWVIRSGKTPMLYGDTITHTWTAVVNTCAEITNTAFLNMLGQPTNSIGAQVITACNAPTPVELISFDVTRSGEKSVLLSWVTASEQNSESYSVQRREENAFVEIAKIKAAGTTNFTSQYSWIDEQPGTCRPVYRLVQKDIDGKSVASPSRSVVLDCIVSLVPSPFGSTLLVNNYSGQDIYLEITDTYGRVIYSSNASETLTLSTQEWAQGLYVARIVMGSESTQYKLVKE